jgi:hypothetical protein
LANANGSAVDTMGFDNVEVVVSAGDIDLTDADETYAVKVQEGAQSTLSDAADISGASVTITADNQLKTIRIVGLGTGSRKRYMRAVLTVGGTTPSIPLAAYVRILHTFSFLFCFNFGYCFNPFFDLRPS